MAIGTPHNLNAALDNLARAASVDWPDAKRELQILARMTGVSWKKLRASVNPEALRRPPPKKALLERPRIRVFENFATPAECDWLIERCRDQLKPATVYENSGTIAASRGTLQF